MPINVEVYEFIYQGKDDQSEVMRITIAATSEVPPVNSAALRHLADRMRKNGTPILTMTRVEEGRQEIDFQARRFGNNIQHRPKARQSGKALFRLIRGGLGGALIFLAGVQECAGLCQVPMMVW